MPTEVTIDPALVFTALARVKDEATFIQELLAVTLNWPIPDEGIVEIEEITYDWPKDERKAPNVEKKLVGGQILEVNLTGPSQHWGIFVLEFNNPAVFDTDRGMTGVLREVLRWLVPRRRDKTGDKRSWNRDHLLFICTHDYSQFRFAYFKDPMKEAAQPRLAAFGWQAGSTEVRTVCEFNLSHLGWPEDPANRELWVAQWSSAFDVEKVTKRFYKDYADEFERLRKAVKGISGEEQKMFTQTLLNRLMFLRFIERKGWLRAPGGSKSNDYLRLLFEAGAYRGKSFYSGRLCKLFFEGLAIEGKQGSEAIGKVPFLNGGLFEQSRLDKTVADIPDNVFEPLLGLDGLFYRYNFTVQESTPLNVEVAVDPEMLGKVFEELVTGRHESGSYYTPRPVVSFMCREALKGYLAGVTKLPDATVAAFVDQHDTHDIGIPEARTLVSALNDVKAVDPACGSGAYLLGLLHEMVDLYRLLYSEKLKSDDQSLHDLKLRIISNSIYGVDIDKFATNIAMLRLWLSLSVDSKKPLPLPNLEFKIETGDSLTGPDPSAMPGLFREKLQRDADALIADKDEYLKCHDLSKKVKLGKIQMKQELIAKALNAELGEGVIDWRIHFAEVFAGKRAKFTIDNKFAFLNDLPGVQGSFPVGDERGGFDIVLANPPYVRQELIKDQKVAFREIFPEVYAGAADLCCYFYGRAIQLLRPGGTLAFISSNKWMRAGYGRGLRSFLLRYSLPAVIVDFGHAPIFPSADTFPCVPIIGRRQSPLPKDTRPDDAETFSACIFPREDYRPEMAIGPYVASRSKRLAVNLLREEAWTLDDPRIQHLLERIRNTGTPLKEFCKGPLYRGPVTGFNEAFYLDAGTREKLIAEDKSSAELIKPLLRGRDVDRWRPRRSNTFIIFARHGVDIAGYPAIKRHLSQYRKSLEARAGEQAWYELQASPSDDFVNLMFRPKIIYQEIQFHSWFSLETDGACLNNKVYMLPTADLALLGVLSSPLMWWFLTRTLPHMKDEALCPAGFLMEDVRVTVGAPTQCAGITGAVQKLVRLADATHDWQHDLTGGLCELVGAEEPDGRVINWLPLEPNVFNARMAKLAGRQRLSDELAAQITAMQMSGRARQIELLREQLQFERHVETLVEDVFGLTPEERHLLRTTKPVRDPLDVLNAKIDIFSRMAV